MNKDKISEIKKEKILIIYSSEQEISFLYQNIVFIKKIVERLDEQYDFYVLTSTDSLKLSLDKKVKIIVKKINTNSVIEIIKNEKIKKIIPIDCDNYLINNVQKHCKVENFFYSYYSGYKNKQYFKNLAKQSGFNIKKVSNKEKRDFRCFNIVAIKDNFGNQVVLDCLESAKIDDKFLFCSFINLKKEIKLQIKQIIDNFGSLLNITNYLYTIKFFINNKNEIIFNNITYGLTNESLFSIQNQQLNIVDMMIKIYNNFSFFKDINNKYIALSFNYNSSLKIDYFNDLKYRQILTTQKNIQENAKLCKFLNRVNKDIIHFRNYNYLKKNDNIKFKAFGEYMLICIGDEFLTNINYQIVFYKICELLKKQTDKKILLLTKYITPFVSYIDNIDIVLCKTYTEQTINDILDIYNVKTAYITPSSSTLNLIEKLQKECVKIYGQDKNEEKLLSLNEECLIDFCNKIETLCQYVKMDETDRIINVYCITDKHKNIVYKNITSKVFQGKINSICHLNPFIKINYDLEKDINDIVNKVVDNLKSFGLLTISFIYKKGDLYINNISVQNNPMIFFISNVCNDIIYDILIQSLIGKNIDTFSKQNIQADNPKFYQKICFERVDKQIITMENITKEKVIKDYNLKFLS